MSSSVVVSVLVERDEFVVWVGESGSVEVEGDEVGDWTSFESKSREVWKLVERGEFVV